ncbi:MAG: hypothetical protein ACI9SP_003126 [Arenicella sp.]|jgi:hypothetical protein
MTNKLKPKQQAFIDCTILIHTYRTITDAYIAVYKPKGSRKTATASASRIYNMPAVKAYREELRAIESQRAVARAEASHQAFLSNLARR